MCFYFEKSCVFLSHKDFCDNKEQQRWRHGGGREEPKVYL